MAKTGIELEVKNEAKFKSEVKNIENQYKAMVEQAKLLTAEFDKEDQSVEALTARNTGLEKSIEAQKKAIETMKAALANASESFGEADNRTLKWQEKLAKAETSLIGMEKELKKNNDAIADMNRETPKLEKLGDIFDGWKEKAEGAKDKMTGITGLKNDYGKLKDAVNACKENHELLFKSIEKVGDAGEKIAKGGLKAIETGAKAAGVALVAVSGAAVKIGKDVVESYAELEQNLGGSEAVFGKYAESIQKTGEEAYKNLGVSQSEYLANANKMGALFQGSGLSQKESLEMTEKAMQRAADMASVMGIETSAALEAVTGAAKGNFTMMDNLGVKMDATTLEAYAMAEGFDKSYKDMSNTEKTELAMQYFFENTKQYAGNFAEEATQTIEGSVGMLKASVESFVAGLGNSDADIANLSQNVVDAFSSVVENVSPVVENLVDALPQVIDTAVEALDGDLLPQLMETAGVLIDALAETAPDIIITLVDGITDHLDGLIDAALEIISALTEGLLTEKNIKAIMSASVRLVTKLVDFLSDNTGLLVDSAFDIVEALVDGLVEDDNMTKLVGASLDIVKELATGIIENLPELIGAAGDMCKALWEAIKNYDWLSLAKSVFTSLKNGIKNLFTGDDDNGGDQPQPPKPRSSNAGGLAFVPEDGYIAELHKGERVLTAYENRTYSDGGSEAATEIRALRAEIASLRKRLDSPLPTNISNGRDLQRELRGVV